MNHYIRVRQEVHYGGLPNPGNAERTASKAEGSPWVMTEQ
jgi:hypothetical protein